MNKKINNVFFKFEHKCDSNFSKSKFEEGLQAIKTYKFNKKDEKNELSIGIPHIGCIGDVEPCPVPGIEGESLFYGRFVKGKYGEQVYFYKNDGDYSTVTDDDHYVGRPSDKSDEEIIVNEFYYIFKLCYDESANIIKGIISKPTFKEFINKSDLEFLVKEILTSNFGAGEVEYNISNFGLIEIFSSTEINRLSGLGATISYVEEKTVGDICDEIGESIDGIDESQVVDLKISINQTNSSPLFPIFKKRLLNPNPGDTPLKNIKLQTPQGTFLDLEGFYFSKKISVNIENGTIIGNEKSFFINELSKFVQNKIYTVI